MNNEQSPIEPCGRDATGVVLEEGEALLCLCCATVAYAHADVEDPHEDGFAYPGSRWVRVAALVSGL